MFWGKKRPEELAGSVIFRGDIPPRPENFDLDRFKPQRLDDVPLAHWQLQFDAPGMGVARIACLRDPPQLPPFMIDHDSRLSPSERSEARLGRSTVSVVLPGKGDNPLRERKRLLGLLQTLMTYGGVVACDHLSQALWSKASLDEECAHDADLDITSLFTIHAISSETEGVSPWVHTHGLKELGFTDFDVVGPTPQVDGSLWDVLRAVAYAIVEGNLRPGGEAVSVVGGAPPVRLVPTSEFRAATGGRHPEWNAVFDDEHEAGHAVLCNGTARRWSWFGKAKAEPWSLLSAPLPDDIPIGFSDAACELMAARALATLPVMVMIREELAGLGLPCLVKLRYGEPGTYEHLWFEVHEVGGSELEATLLNEPFGNLAIHQGDRGRHAIDRLSDWQFLTPAGSITPRGLAALRTIREHRPLIEAAIRGEAS